MGSILRCVVLYMRLAHVTRAGLWCLRISRCSARIAYCSIFALSLIISWILCEVAAPLMEKLPCLPSQTFSMLFAFVPFLVFCWLWISFILYMIWKICFIWGFFVVVCDTSKVAKICKKREKLSWREEKEFSQWPPQWT